MKKTVNQSGITLIALVVTIVVLLILAGITITYVLAEGGLFDRAQDAAFEQEMANIRDYAGLAQAELMIESAAPSGEYDADYKILEANFPAGYALSDHTGVTATDGKFTGTFTVTTSKGIYSVEFEEGVIPEDGVQKTGEPSATP